MMTNRVTIINDKNTFHKSNLISEGQLTESWNGFDEDDKALDTSLNVRNETVLQHLSASVNVNARNAEYRVVFVTCQRLHRTKHLLLQSLLLLCVTFTTVLITVGKTER